MVKSKNGVIHFAVTGLVRFRPKQNASNPLNTREDAKGTVIRNESDSPAGSTSFRVNTCALVSVL